MLLRSQILRLLALFITSLVVAACGDEPSVDNVAAPAGSRPSLTGAWERFIPDRNAPIAYEVVEFFDNGWMILHNAQGGLNARYAIDDDEHFTISGALAAYWSGEVAYEIEGDTLTLEITAAGSRVRSVWTNIRRDAFFGIDTVVGDVVPTGLPKLLADATAGVARDWRTDAIPVALDLQRLPSGDFAVVLSFVSPSDRAGMRLTVGRWGYFASELPRASWGDHALPTEFADAPALRARLSGDGNGDPILSASLRVWSKGPIWSVTTLSAVGRQTRTDLAAPTAAAIAPEAPPKRSMSEEEYIASYNAQWQAISKAFASKRASGAASAWDSQNPSSEFGSSGGSAEPAAAGCAYESHGACNAAAAGDLWGADRIENGTASQSERDWYD